MSARSYWSFIAAFQLGSVVHDFITHYYSPFWMIVSAGTIGYGTWHAVYGYRWPGWEYWKKRMEKP